MCAGQAELVQEVEIVPKADAIAVVAPSVVALVLRTDLAGRVAADSGAEGEELDVVAEEDREPFPLRPLVDRALVDRNVVVASVAWQFHPGHPLMPRPVS